MRRVRLSAVLILAAAGAVPAAGCLTPSFEMPEDPARERELAAKLCDPAAMNAQELYDARMIAFTRALKESGHPLGGMLKLGETLRRLAERMNKGEIATPAQFQAEALKEGQAAFQEEPPGAASFKFEGQAAADLIAVIGCEPRPGVTCRSDTFVPGGQAVVQCEILKADSVKLLVAYFDRRLPAKDAYTLERLFAIRVLADKGLPVAAEQQAALRGLDEQLFAAARQLVSAAADQSTAKPPDPGKLSAAIAALRAAEKACRDGSPLTADQRAALKAAQDEANRAYYTRMVEALQAK